MKKKIVGILVSDAAVVGKNSQLRQSVVNTLVRQIKNLRKDGHDAFLFVSNAEVYCKEINLGENLRKAIGKVNIASMYSEAFSRKNIMTCLPDCDKSIIKATIQECFDAEIMPIIAGNFSFFGACEVDMNSSCTQDEVYFTFLCRIMQVNRAIVVSSGDEISKKENEFRMLFPEEISPQFALFYKPDFLLQAVRQNIERCKYAIE